MEHDTSTLRLIIRNTEQRTATARAVVALGPDPVNGLDGTLPFPIDGDTLTHMRRLTQAGRHGYHLATSDAHTALNPLREALRAGEAVA